jgi:hypothetical protein
MCGSVYLWGGMVSVKCKKTTNDEYQLSLIYKQFFKCKLECGRIFFQLALRELRFQQWPKTKCKPLCEITDKDYFE